MSKRKKKEPVLVEITALPGDVTRLLRRLLHLHHARQILIYGGNMGLTVVAGGAALLVQLIPLPSGTIFDSPADLELTADDTAVQIAAAPGDTTGTLFEVTVPTTDTNASFNLDATGLAGGVQVLGTVQVSIMPAAPPPPPPPAFATSIGIVEAPGVGTSASQLAPSAPVGNQKAKAGS